mmetsp:Transcript_11296/g.24838  ORF Transcript_11296/g.24838 Transcript_11296/m.24838 type:complete len:146 (+) Transcript_11296:827-1264(+)
MVNVGTACKRLAVLMSGMMGGGFSEAADADCEASDVMAKGVTRTVWMIFLLLFDLVAGADEDVVSSLLLADDSPTIVLREVDGDCNPAGPMTMLFESEAGVAKDSTFTGKDVAAAAIKNNGRESMVNVRVRRGLAWAEWVLMAGL